MNWPVNPLRGNQTKPLTGEPCAGNPPARFGGGRGRNQSVLPTPIENWDDATPMVFWFWTRPAIIATPWCSRWRLSRASRWHADKHEGGIPHCSAKLHVFARCPEEVRLSAPQQGHELLELLRLAEDAYSTHHENAAVVQHQTQRGRVACLDPLDAVLETRTDLANESEHGQPDGLNPSSFPTASNGAQLIESDCAPLITDAMLEKCQ